MNTSIAIHHTDGMGSMSGKKSTSENMQIILPLALVGYVRILDEPTNTKSKQNLPFKKKKLVNVRDFVNNVDYIPLTEDIILLICRSTS